MEARTLTENQDTQVLILALPRHSLSSLSVPPKQQVTGLCAADP